MNYGPPNFYEDGVRPAVHRNYPQRRCFPVKVEPEMPPVPSIHATTILTLVETSSRAPTLQEIIMAVCAVTGVVGKEFHSPRQQRRIVTARQVYYYLARELTSKSYPEIGRRCGGKDHTTVMHGVRKIEANLAAYADTIAAVKKQLGGGADG